MSASPDFHAGRAETGLLLVGHGSREPAGVDEFLAAARFVAARAGTWAVEPCFLEFAEPSIAVGFERLARRGVPAVVVAPVILFAAGHIRHDIPRTVAQAAAGHPDLRVEQAEHLGCHEAILELSALRYDEAVARRASIPPEETTLVMVGRGSRDAEAIAQMLRFASMGARQARGAQVRTAFLAMADPPLEQVLAEVARSAAKRIVIQPHLLFAGELVGRIGAMVERVALTHPQAQWLVTGHLGPSALVATAVLDRARAAVAAFGQPR